MGEEMTVFDVFQFSKDKISNNSPPTWVARFPIRKEAVAYAEEMIEGDFTSYHIQEAQQTIPDFQNLDQFVSETRAFSE